MPSPMIGRDEIQRQNIPIYIDEDEPDLRRMIIVLKETLRRLNDLDDRIKVLENWVNK